MEAFNPELKIYPDPILRKKAREIDDFSAISLTKIGETMLEFMYEHNGIGLAANQVGLDIKIIVYDISEERNKPNICINPRLIKTSKEKIIEEEGCLSIPGIRAKVKRYKNVIFGYFDPSGKFYEKKVEELEARCVQHEIDHLEGILFIDKLSPVSKLAINSQLKKLRKLNS